MALTDDNLNATMLMQPAGGISYGVPYGMPYGNGGGLFGGGNDLLGLLFVIALCNGGFGGFGFGGGYGAMMGAGMMGMDFLYPWLNNSQNINDGFRDQMMNDNVNSIRDGVNGISKQICECCGDMQLGLANGVNSINQNLCNGFNGVTNSIFGAQTAISQQLSANEIASLNRSFAEQSANQQGFNGVQAQLAQNGYNQAAGIADVKYTIAKEACDTRSQAAMNARDIVDAIRGGDQMLMDKLCALELNNEKAKYEQAQREIVSLQNAVNMATTRAENLANADNIVNSLYNRLSTCPVGTTPVFGNQPIFTCAQNVAGNNCGCGR